MGKRYNRWEKFYNQLSMVFHGIIAISMIPFAWVFLETQKEFPDDPMLDGSSLLAVKIAGASLCVLIMLISYRYGNNLLVNARSYDQVDDKLKSYLNERKKDFLLLELGAVIAFIGLYLTKDQIFSLMYVAVLIMFSTKRPRYERITEALKLSDEEIEAWINEEKNKDDKK